MSDLPFTITDPAFHADPYRFYARMREQAVVARARATGDWSFWMLTHYADIAAALRDARLGREVDRPTQEYLQSLPENHRPALQLINDWMLLRNPPNHTRLRGLVNRAFTPRVVEDLRPRITQIANELLDRAVQQETIDLVADFAFPLPVIVIAELIGVPAADRDLFRRWSEVLIELIDLNQTEETLVKGSRVARELGAYIRALIAERRIRPQADLLSGMIAAEQQGDRLSEDELIANCALLLTAGHETTVGLIAGGALGLLEHPDQWARLCNEPALLTNAVEELLRFQSPVQMTFRSALADLEIGGQFIQQGEQICIAVAAANRDPRIFADPDALIIDRPNAGKHLAFGAGIHFCVGAALARAEGQIAIAALTQRFPRMRLDGVPTMRAAVALRGPDRLPVALS